MKAIVTKFHGPTDVRSARVTARDSDGNSFTVPTTEYADPHLAAAIGLVRKVNFARGTLKGGEEVFVIVTDIVGVAA